VTDFVDANLAQGKLLCITHWKVLMARGGWIAF
jgi:hypothetical protein